MPPKTILVVDDEPHIRQVLEMKLEGLGYEVKTASNAAIGLRAIEEAAPDLIISDYNMPGEKNGVDLIRGVRERLATANTPVILLTGSVAIAQKLETELKDISNLRLETKPFSPRKLAGIVHQLLEETA